MLVPAEVFWVDAVLDVPVEAGFFDFLIGFFVLVWGDEVLGVGLFEFAGAEEEVTWGDFVSESFADLGDTEGDF